jgi:hypothetical protein
MPVSIGPTLSRNNQQPVFLAQGNGVIYIKIARKDNQGNDNTLSLQELNNIRLKFSDAGIIDYPIANITEYPDYYLYQIFRTNATSSIDDNIRNYRFSASAYTPPFSVLVSGDSSVDIDLYTSKPFDYLNYFNTSSGIYTFGDTPNVKIIYTASVLVSTGGTRTVGFSLTPPTGSAIASTSTNVNGTATLTIQGTASFLENTQLLLRFANDSAPGQDATISNIQWQFTQSFAPNSSSNLTILEPYLESEFEYSDCNVLLNNADQNQIGSFFRRVLYDNGSIIPSNFQEILSQSAEYAEVKDYNYTARAQIYPRYNGVRTTSPDFNLRTINVGTYEGTRLDSIATGDPNVQSLGTYFAYFDYLGGTTPELINKAAAHILYLIDEDGNVQNPNISSSYYYNLIDSFESGKKANIVLNAISGNPQIIGNIPIIYGGAIPMPILASQTQSDATPYPTISFYNPATSPPDYVSTFSTNTQNLNANQYYILDLNTNIYSLPASVSQNGDNIQINTTSNLTQIAIQAILDLSYIDNIPFGNSPGQVYVTLQESPDSGVTWNAIGGDQFSINDNQTLTYTVTSNYVIPTNGNRYRCIIFLGNSVGNLQVIGGSNGSTLGVIQNIPASNAQVTSGSGLEYFTTGSNSKNILTGSQFTNIIYNQTNPLTQYSPFSGSGYFPFLPFSINVGDQIRFEGDEGQVYTIIDVNAQFHNVPFNLVLDRNIVDGTNTNSFLIRRFDLNPNYIILDTSLASYQGGGGFIFPQYTTNVLQANFDRIIKDLKEKGLIS